jgi:hypothetical protein
MNEWQAEIRILIYEANDWRGKYVACLYEAEDLAVADDDALRRATGSGDTPLEAAAALLNRAVSEYRVDHG